MSCYPSFAFIFLYIHFFWPRLPSLSLPCLSPFSSVCNFFLPVSKEGVIEGKRVPFLGEGDIMGKLEILLLSVEVVWLAMSLSRLSPFKDDILEILFCFSKEELVNAPKRTLGNYHISDTLRPHSYHDKDLGGAQVLVIVCFRCETQSCWHDIFWVLFLSNYKMAVIINALPTWQVVVGMKWENSCANTLKSLKHSTHFITVFCSLADSLCPISFVKFYKTPCVLLETSDHLSYLSEMCQRGHLCWWWAIILFTGDFKFEPCLLILHLPPVSEVCLFHTEEKPWFVSVALEQLWIMSEWVTPGEF